MQYAMIITKSDSYQAEQGGTQFRLCVEDYQGRAVSLFGVPGQQVNIQTIRSQSLPIIMLADNIESHGDGTITIPLNALVSVVPLPAASIQSIVQAGRGAEILQNLGFNNR